MTSQDPLAGANFIGRGEEDMNQITDDFNESARIQTDAHDSGNMAEAERRGTVPSDEQGIAGDTNVTEGLVPIMPFLPDPDDEFRDDRSPDDVGHNVPLSAPASTVPRPKLVSDAPRYAGEARAEYHSRDSLLNSLGTDLTVVVVGASGGIGAAMTDMLEEDPAVSRVFAFTRSGSTFFGGNVVAGHIDFARERTIARAAAAASSAKPIHLVAVASGHMQVGSGEGSESGLRSLDGVAMANAYQVNVIGPALVAKHFLPLMPRSGKSVFAVLSDNVDRFETNQDPGLLGYSGSKAALNTIIRGLARELATDGRETTCVGLFPGVVDTPMSRPLRSFAGDDQLVSPDFAAKRLIRVIAGLVPGDSGGLFAWDGSVISDGV